MTIQSIYTEVRNEIAEMTMFQRISLLFTILFEIIGWVFVGSLIYGLGYMIYSGFMPVTTFLGIVACGVIAGGIGVLVNSWQRRN